MDIRKNTLHGIRRFALKATASAILTLNAEFVIANNPTCSPEINGSSLAGLICDFVTATGPSVTVEKDGTVGGISLTFPTAPTSPAYIRINAGGTISNTMGAPGISIINSSLSDGISNGGTISSTGYGIEIQTSTINGGISNSGTINSGSTAIKISNSTINGGISNSGLINSINRVGIAIKSSHVNGGIFNSGTITSTLNEGIAITNNTTINGGISNTGSINTHNIGIEINHSYVNNGIFNSGTINSSRSSGIKIYNSSTVNGGISNSGIIKSNLSDDGIVIFGSSLIRGDISNSNAIYALGNGNAIAIHNAILEGGISNSGTLKSINATGMAIYVLTTIQGNISNSGVISGLTEGLTLHNSSTVDGDLFNGGTIRGGMHGLSIYSTMLISGKVSNSGLISGINTGISITGSATTISGGISNSGIIASAGIGLSVSTNTTINNDIFNSGMIHGDNVGLHLFKYSTINGNISNDGTISGLNNGIFISSLDGGNTIINGGISNRGVIGGGNNGILISDNATISGGISNSGIIQGDSYAIKISNSTVDHIDIFGQSAQIIGKVDAPDTAVNITRDAIFTSSEDSYNVKTFNVDSRALFNMKGTITAKKVKNSGILATTNSQIIEGKYKQHKKGIFQTEVLSASNYGSLSVTGKVDLTKSGNIYVKVEQNSSLHNGDILSNIISGSSLKTNGINVSDNSYIWVFTPQLNNSFQELNASPTGIDLIVTVNPNSFKACQGAYCQGALTTIMGQVTTGNPIFGSYGVLPTASALRTAASQATPELTNENIQVLQLITRSVLDIVPMWSSLHGKSSGDAMLYQPGKVWLKPYGGAMTQNERSTVEGFNATAYGAVIGKDFQLNQDWLFGGAFAAGGDNMRGKSVLHGQTINSNAYQGMLYGAKKFSNQIYFAGQGLVGYENNNTHRSIPLYDSTAKGAYDSWFTNIRAEAGWSIYALSPNLVLTPEIDVSYLYINQGGYNESGSPMDLRVASNNNSSLILGAYSNGAYHVTTIHDKQDLTLTGYAGLAGNVLNSQPQTVATFVAGGPSFSTYGAQFNGLVFRGGAGLTLTSKSKPLSIELNYDVQAGNNAYSNMGAATIKYKA